MASIAQSECRPLSSEVEILGLWEVIALEPKTDENPLKNEKIYFLFLPSMSFLEIIDPVEQTKYPKTTEKKYKILNSIVTIIDVNNEKTEHRVFFEENIMNFEVSFGKLKLKKAL